MRIAQGTRIGAWVLICLNLLMALGSIWIFMRMSPAIKIIIEQNEHSLKACEDMLASLATANIYSPPQIIEKSNVNNLSDIENKISYIANKDNDINFLKRFKDFQDALNRATKNITEEEENSAVDMIKSLYKNAFKGDKEAVQKTVAAIISLGEINREAMIQAHLRARQLGQAGAWGVVFMASSLFFAGMIFNRNLLRNVVRPIEEIHSVIAAYRNGETMRRCSGADLSADFISVFHGINEILDKCQSQFETKDKFLY